jgi:hypothetical protein
VGKYPVNEHPYPFFVLISGTVQGSVTVPDGVHGIADGPQ